MAEGGELRGGSGVGGEQLHEESGGSLALAAEGRDAGGPERDGMGAQDRLRPETKEGVAPLLLPMIIVFHSLATV